MPKVQYRSNCKPSTFAYPPALEVPKEKEKEKVRTEAPQQISFSEVISQGKLISISFEPSLSHSSNSCPLCLLVLAFLAYFSQLLYFTILDALKERYERPSSVYVMVD